MPNWNNIYSNLFSGPIPAGEVTPDSDNVDFDDFPGVNKAKMRGGDDFADGNDQANVIFGNGGCDYLRGDGGDDSLHGGNHDDAIIGDDPSGMGQQGDDLLWGGSGNDVIAGQGGDDNLDGGNGRDLLIGGNGNDYANGGMGEDFIIGGNGRDTLLGGWNDDCLAGQLGNDSMRGGTGNDLMSGGDGEDTMYGGSHNDTMSGNAGHDYINAGNGHDVAYGNSGDDVMRGWNGNDSMRGDCGDDALDGGRGNDLLLGDKGQDNITGGAGDDSIDGGKHGDIIEGNDNADCIKGGEGDDLIYGDNANPFDPASGEASDLISGGSGEDTIHGGEDDDQINGDEDDDLIFGDTGNDTIAGDEGDDTIDGGSGNDHISGGSGKDSIDGGIGNDILSGGGDNDTINGGNGHDCIDGGAGRDRLNGGNGSDTIDGGGGADTIDGGNGNDFLYGGSDGGAGDLIRGDLGGSMGGNDTLLGGAGNDTLQGGKGDDCLISGTGNETLTGGGDADVFVFGYDLDVNSDGDCDDEEDRSITDHGSDIITDLNTANDDVIMLHNDLAITNVSLDGNDMVIVTSGGLIRVVDAVLNISGLNPGDPDFNGSSDALKAFITDYNPDNGEGKGFVYFDDKCVTLPNCEPDRPETGWEVRFPDEVKVTKDLSDKRIGDTTKNITEQIMADRYINSDVNVNVMGDQILFDPDASTPPTVEVTPSTEVIEDIDASAQIISDSGIVSFDDIDSTDTVTITYEVKDAPVWSHGDFANVALDPQDLIAAFFTGVEDAAKPGTTPWTWEGTFDLDFLAKDETITFTIDVIATDCDDASSRVPLEFLITGTNDEPTIEVTNNGVLNETAFVEASDASAQGLSYAITKLHDDLDYNDELVLRIDSNNDIAWSGGALNPALAAALEFGGGVDGFSVGPLQTPSQHTLFTFPGPFDLDFLREGETITWSYTATATDPHGAFDTDVANFVITGTNDRPVAADLFFMLNEDDSSAAVDTGDGNVDPFAPLIGTAPTYNFVVTDDDTNDTHTFEIVGLDLVPGETNVYQTIDEFGNAYGKLTNNNDGTFTFDPEDDFQHLEEGETREVTFQYQARDDSGVGETPLPPSESELSALKTVTLTVKGSDDDPLRHTDDLLFVTDDQSIWDTGPAFNLNPDLPFIGFDTGGEINLDKTIWGGININSGAVLDTLNGLIDAGEIVVETACEIFTLGFGDCSVDFGDVDSITVPGIYTEGFVDAKIGLQPYFFLNGGELEADIPVEVVFTAPRQVEQGEIFNVGSAFTVDGGATFETDGPSVQFGLDFVLDIAAELLLDIFGGEIPLFDFDTADLLGTGTLGEPGFNIFDVSPGDTFEIPLPAGSTLDLTNPDFATLGMPTNPPSNTHLEGMDTEELADLTLDIDGALSALIPAFPPLGGGESFGLSQSFGDLGSVDVFTVGYEWDLLDIDLQGILSAVQDFTLDITELPLMATLEDGITTITGFSVGDNISVDVPLATAFDVDIDGDADGMMDFDVAIDMKAVFENVTELGFDMNLILGFLRLTAEFTSDFADDLEFSLFDGLVPSLPFDPDPNDNFLFGGTIPLLEDVTLAELYHNQFPVEGWNSQDTTFDFDVA
jgi:Ca2+-binding RTX toxin-like protein